MTAAAVVQSSPLGKHRDMDEDLRSPDDDPDSADAVITSSPQSLKPRQIIAARTPDALKFKYSSQSSPSPESVLRFTSSCSPQSVDLTPSTSRHLGSADVVFNRDVVSFPDRLPYVNGKAGTPTRNREPFTGGSMFSNDFRFLEAFAERSKAHPFGGVGGSPVNDRKRKFDSASDREWSSFGGVRENSVEDSNKLDMTTGDVDPMSALLRRYGTSSDLLSSLQRSAPSVVPGSPTPRQPQQPSSNLDDQRQPMEQNNGGFRQQQQQQPQQTTPFEGEDSRSGHGNNGFGGGGECTGAESTVSSGLTGSSSEEAPRQHSDVINENGEKNYYCHMCSYMGTSHSDYLSHTSSHFRHRCNLCDYMSTTAGRLKRHLHECHVIPAKCDDVVVAAEVLPVTAASAPGSSTSSGSSGAAVETRKKKCRKCEFQTSDQDEFYEHARTHIRPDRIIECPMCRFATQYRHHLELHLRNHLGSKPHQCPNCDYCCPVASMLASHMKSHSRVNRYRCAECNFSTKFSNALKRHLLAKDHEYGIVLNDDGSLPPEGPQRFYPNSTSARRRRGAGRSAWTADKPNQEPPTPVPTAGTVTEDMSSQNVIVPMARFSADDASRLMSSINSGTALMTSPQAAFQSVMIKQEDVRNHDLEKKASAVIQVAPPAPQRYHHDQTGSGFFNMDRLRCLVCGFPARGVPELTHHLMTSHGLHTTVGNGAAAMPTSPKKPRLEPTGSPPNYFRKRVDEERKFDDVKMPSPAFTHMRNGDGRFCGVQSPLLPMWSGTHTPVGVPSTMDAFRGPSSGMNLIRQQFEDNLNQLSLNSFNQSPLRLDDHVTMQHRSKPSSSFAPHHEAVHHASPLMSSVPLDLSAKSTSNVTTPQLSNLPERHEDMTSSAAATKKSRRKGRAFKIDTSAILNESIEDQLGDDYIEAAALGAASFSVKPTVDQSKSFELNTGNGHLDQHVASQRMNPPKKNPALRPVSPAATIGAVAKSPSSTTEDEKLSGSNVDGELFECPYCGLGFRDRTLHLMHMEFHDLRPGSDPFQCKLCGQQTGDQLEFFLHIARAPHLNTKMTSSSEVVRTGSRLVSAIS